MALSSTSATVRNPSATFTVRRFTAFTSSCTLLRPPSILRVPRTAVLSVKCRQSAEYDYEDSPASFARTQREPAFSPHSNSVRYYTGGKVFTNYRVYKGKAVLDLEPKPPELAPLGVFSLSVTEIGSLVNLGPEESCEIFHDPNMGRSDEGKVQKVLKVEPLPDRSGHFFSLRVTNMLLNTDSNIYIPVTKAEFTVLVTAFKVGTSLQIPVGQMSAAQMQIQGLLSIIGVDKISRALKHPLVDTSTKAFSSGKSMSPDIN
ncbi:Single-stranded DNA-binding protein WHY1, chloroplastic-like protein [Drosera capensis]